MVVCGGAGSGRKSRGLGAKQFSCVVRPWKRRAESTPAPEVITPSPPLAPVPNPEVRKKIADSILNFEARRDANGHLRVYNLPPSDGGGRYEVAGINERYDPEEAAKLRDLVNAGRFDEAERDAAEYIAQYTDIVSKWTTCPFDRGLPAGLHF